jgi:hypothetical protein
LVGRLVDCGCGQVQGWTRWRDRRSIST